MDGFLMKIFSRRSTGMIPISWGRVDRNGEERSRDVLGGYILGFVQFTGSSAGQ